jgi:hypothetical protein
MTADSKLPTSVERVSITQQQGLGWLPWAVLSLIVACTLIVENFYHNLWYDAFAPRMGLVDLADGLSLPLWLAFTITAFVRFPAPRKRLWWLLLPAPFCLRFLLEFLATMLAWSIHGFSP